jgi:hypothetical protein
MRNGYDQPRLLAAMGSAKRRDIGGETEEEQGSEEEPGQRGEVNATAGWPA